MAFMEVNWNPSDRMLRNFGRAGFIISLILACLLHFSKGVGYVWCGAIVGAGGGVFLCSIVSLKAARWIYLALTAVTYPIHIAMGFVIPAIFYYLLLTPTGIIFRVIGRDVLGRKIDKTASSYWVDRKGRNDLKQYFRQF